MADQPTESLIRKPQKNTGLKVGLGIAIVVAAVFFALYIYYGVVELQQCQRDLSAAQSNLTNALNNPSCPQAAPSTSTESKTACPVCETCKTCPTCPTCKTCSTCKTCVEDKYSLYSKNLWTENQYLALNKPMLSAPKGTYHLMFTLNSSSNFVLEVRDQKENIVTQIFKIPYSGAKKTGFILLLLNANHLGIYDETWTLYNLIKLNIPKPNLEITQLNLNDTPNLIATLNDKSTTPITTGNKLIVSATVI
jgi:hypothetical protein